MRERRRAVGDRLARVGEIRGMDDRTQAVFSRLGDERLRDLRLHLQEPRLRVAAPAHVVQHELDLRRSERLRLAHRLARGRGRRREAVQVRVGRLALVPPAAFDREDRGGREHVRESRPGIARALGQLGRRGRVLRHEANRGHAPPQHLLEVRVRLRVHVRVHEARHDPLARDVRDRRSRGQRRDRRRPSRHRPRRCGRRERRGERSGAAARPCRRSESRRGGRGSLPEAGRSRPGRQDTSSACSFSRSSSSMATG